MSVVALWLVASATAEVVVIDDTECLDPGLLYEELEQRDALPEHVDLDVTIEARDTVRIVGLAAKRDGEARWTRELEVEDVDCPHLHTAAAITVQRGLSALPASTWRPTRRVGVWFGGSVGASLGTGPAWPRARLSFLTAAGSIARWTSIARVEAGPWNPLGVGETRITTAVFGTGAEVAPRIGTVELRPGLRLLGGLAIVSGRGFEPNVQPLAPRAATAAELAVGSGRWSIAAELLVPLTPLVIHGALTDQSEESPLRFALSFGWIREFAP